MSILQNLGGRIKQDEKNAIATRYYVQKKPELKVERVGVQ
jgi:hypothetical protein